MNIINCIVSVLPKVLQPSPPDCERIQIAREIKEVKNLIDAAENNFNNVTDSDSIDYYTYILKAYKIRYNKLIKDLKLNTSQEIVNS